MIFRAFGITVERINIDKDGLKQSQHAKCGVANCLFLRDHVNYITHKVNYLNKIPQHN